MRSQSSVFATSTKTLSTLTLTSNKEPHRSTTPVVPYHSTYKKQSIQMTTGGGINNPNNNSTSATTTIQQSSSNLASCNTIPSSSSLNTLSKSSTISSTIRHSNISLSSNNINNNSTTAINNNKISTNININNNNEGNHNPNSSKLQTLEQRKVELEKLLNEKNWLLQQIYKQEAQIINGSYENFSVFESGKESGNVMLTVGTTSGLGSTNSILRRKGSSSLKLPRSNVHSSGKGNRFTLSKSEYDLAQENKFNNPQALTNANSLTVKKRQGPPQKTNSFHDNTSTSALSLTKSSSFEYSGSTSQSERSPVIVSNCGSTNHGIKYTIVRPHLSSDENLPSNVGITQCDKYYLSPTSQMYTDGNGFIKASQNIKQCSTPTPLHKIINLNDSEVHLTQQQQIHMVNGHSLAHHNGNQPLDEYESVAALSLPPSSNFELTQHVSSPLANFWRTVSNNDRSAWCDNRYIELDSDSLAYQYHTLNPLAKKNLSTTSISASSLQHSPESPSLGNFYPIGGIFVNGYPNTIEKSCDEVSISSVNSETNKKPKNKPWMESSLDGPIIRPNILQATPSLSDATALSPVLSPTSSQTPQYVYYNAALQGTAVNATTSSGKLTTSPALPAVGGNSLLVVPAVNSRTTSRTLTYHSHPHQKQSYRERTKLSSQSMSGGSYRTPKTKIDDDNNHLSHSTSYLNVDSYHHHFQPSYHFEIPQKKGNVMLLPFQQQQQKQLPQFHQQQSPKLAPPISSQLEPQLTKFSQSIQPQQSSSLVNDDFVETVRYSTSVATQPSRVCSSSPSITTNNIQQKPIPPNSFFINNVQQMSTQNTAIATTSPDIRIESPKNMTVIQQATFLPYKEVTKPFEMSDFYKYSTKFRQKEANTATLSKNSA